MSVRPMLWIMALGVSALALTVSIRDDANERDLARRLAPRVLPQTHPPAAATIRLVTSTTGTATPAADTAPATEPPGAEATDAAGQYPQILPDGIGAARQGMTLADVRRGLPLGQKLSAPDENFLVDVVALHVVAGKDTIYSLLFHGGAALADSTHVDVVATTHPGLRTPEGVGPGSMVAEEAARFGPPTFTYSVNDESREYVTFPRYSAPHVLFRASGPNCTDAGIYPPLVGEWSSTKRYVPGSYIMMVLVEL